MAVTVIALFASAAFSRVRQENQRLAARLSAVENPLENAPAAHAVDNPELAALRQETREIHRLRNEMTQLHDVTQELERLRNKNSELQETIDAEKEKIQAEWAAWISGVRTNGLYPSDVSALVVALTNESRSIRLEATKALRQIGLQQILDPNLKPQAGLELREAAQMAVPPLVAALRDSDPFVRANSAITLGFLNEQPDIVVPALLNCLDDEQDRVALSATKALGRFQSDAKAALPALLQAVKGGEPGRRAASTAAIKQIDPEFAKTQGLE